MTLLSFNDPRAVNPELSGGKGANLAALTQAGFAVPDGFILPVELYRAFLEINGLAGPITERIAACRPDDPDSLEFTSREIRSRFRAGRIPQTLEKEIFTAYRGLGSPPVAVRSSATAEDLPDLSFAGQQDTFLDVEGGEHLLQAVRECWGSLWTARAIGYRARNRIPADGLALAVVVQRMVPSELAGVLFTANPLTGLRAETVIDAIPGLGEGLVSGQVEPDHYVVETASGVVRTAQYGLRSLDARGGVRITRDRPRLDPEQLRALTELGARVAATQGAPQDIEWAYASGVLHLLQARPVTSLYPLPAEMQAGPLRLMFSFGSVQGTLDPLTPIGQDTFQCVVCGMAGILGFRLSPETQQVLFPAGERLWIDITPLFTHRLGRKVVLGALGYVDPAAKLALSAFEHDERLRAEGDRPSPRLILHAALHVPPLGLRILRNLLRPAARYEDANRQGNQLLESVRERCASIGGTLGDLSRRTRLIREMTARLPDAVPAFVTGLMAGMISFNLTRMLAECWLPDWKKAIPRMMLEATRGLPNNVTTEMDLALFATSRRIRGDTAGLRLFETRSAEELAGAYRRAALPAETQSALADFLRAYGMRGLSEIDLGRARWREDPLPVIHSLLSYLTIEDGPLAPDRVFARGRVDGETVLERIFDAVRARRFGRLKERILRFFAGRMRALMGIRESPKFLIIRLMGILREALLESGAELVERKILTRPDDVFWLHLDELQALAAGKKDGWTEIIAARRALFERESRRRRIPRLLLSTGEAVYESAPSDEGSLELRGDPVSPGMVEGRVRVIRDPRGARLDHGEILVCPGTDPSWTPLFLSAGGLVMEVGGMMTHGSVVAREYGIPAVVGVDSATERLTTGMRVRVDGSRGIVEILAPDSLPAK